MSQHKNPWSPYNDGNTKGEEGSEKGFILRDDAYEGVRITLEYGSPTAPFAITCGIAWWMVHTCYCSDEEEAHLRFEEMKLALAEIYESIPEENDTDLEKKLQNVADKLEGFIERFS